MHPATTQLTTLQRAALWVALAQSVAATVGSLIASEIMRLPACDLCWWQRIFWYPLVVVFTVGLVRRETASSSWTALPLAVLGWLLSVYHVLLQAGVFAEGVAPCSLDNPCTIKQSLFPAPLDVITIPMLSVAGFSLILLCLFVVRWYRPVPQRA